MVAGLRYGEGILYTKNAGDLRVFWQGPSLGYDFGVDGARTMMLKIARPMQLTTIYHFVASVLGSLKHSPCNPHTGRLAILRVAFNLIDHEEL